jgi:predicted PurR-regulated permease PerM
MSDQTEPIAVTTTKHSILRPVLLIAGVLVILIIMRSGSSVIGPSLFFVFLAILLVPVYKGLRGKGLSSGVAVLLILLASMIVVVGLGWILWTTFSQLINQIGAYSEAVQVNTEQLQQALAQIQLDPETITNINHKLFEVGRSLMSGFINSIVSLTAGVIMALVALAFIMLESEHFSKRLTVGLKDEKDLLTRLVLFQKSLFKYVIARVKLNLLTGAGVLIMLLLFGVDYALLWGLLAFLLSFIPYIGLVVAAIPAVLLGTAESGLTVGILLAVGYLIINQVIEQVIEPRIVGKEMTLSPTLTLFSVIFWTWILGSLGAMLAGPLAALMILILGAFDDTRWLAIFFSSEDSPLVTGTDISKSNGSNN